MAVLVFGGGDDACCSCKQKNTSEQNAEKEM
jgi:hypothetical protein